MKLWRRLIKGFKVAQRLLLDFIWGFSLGLAVLFLMPPVYALQKPGAMFGLSLCGCTAFVLFHYSTNGMDVSTSGFGFTRFVITSLP